MEPSAVVTPPYVAGPLRLEPFRGLMLDPKRVGDPASARLYARPYRGVASRLLSWIDRGDVVKDDHPALYLHEYTGDGLTIRGVVGALDVSRRAATVGESAVLPHEGIHPLQADELADRMEEMLLNPAPILLTQASPAIVRESLAAVMATPPMRSFTDRSGQQHRIWAIRSPQLIDKLGTAWSSTSAMIADGHHRYAAYLRVQRRRPGGAADRGLAMLIDHADTPLYLGAIHRVLHGVALGDLQDAVAAIDCSWTQTSRAHAVAALGSHTLAVSDGHRWATIALPCTTATHAAVESLHDLIIPGLARGPQRITYHHTVDSALARTRHGRDVTVLLPAPTVGQIWEAVRGGRLLPEKATSFQPKPSPGVLIRSLRDEPSAP